MRSWKIQFSHSSLISLNAKCPSQANFGVQQFSIRRSENGLIHRFSTHKWTACDPKICHNFVLLTNACATCILHTYFTCLIQFAEMLRWMSTAKCWAELKVRRYQMWLLTTCEREEKTQRASVRHEILQNECAPTVSLNIRWEWIMVSWLVICS